MANILLDINLPEFQQHLFSLEKLEQRAILNTLKKISNLTWEELYTDTGIKWELIVSKKVYEENKLYSFRFSQKYRGVACRQEKYLVLLGLFADHDGAYNIK